MSWQLRAQPAQWFIYTLLCPITGAVRYVGFSADVAKRFKRHMKNGRAMERDYPVNRWINDLLRRGMEPECVIVQSGAGPWESAEAEWIAYFKASGYDLLNVCEGGFFAVPREARIRAGEKLKGRAKSEECRQALSNALTGRKRPDAIELGRRMAENNRGKKRVMTEAVVRACRENGLKARGNLKAWTSLSEEEKADRAARTKAKLIAYHQSLTPEQKKARSEAIRAGQRSAA
jgi:hypothetical protein